MSDALIGAATMGYLGLNN